MSTHKKIVILAEDQKRTKFITDTLAQKKVPYEFWDLSSNTLDLAQVPIKNVVYYNRVSPSSAMRNNHGTPSFAKLLLTWLEHHGATIINPPHTLDIEMSKGYQTMLLNAAGISTPKTFACVGKTDVAKTLKTHFMNSKVVVKTNLGGSGAHVETFKDGKSAAAAVASEKIKSFDGVFIVQEFVQSIAHTEQQQITQCAEVDPAAQPIVPLLEIPQPVEPGPTVPVSGRRTFRARVVHPQTPRYQGRQQGSQPAVVAKAVPPPKLAPVNKKAPPAAPEYAYRLEIIGHKPMYVLRMNTDQYRAPARCPCEGGSSTLERFQVLMKPEREIPLVSATVYKDFVAKAVQMTKDHKIGTAAFEFKINASGVPQVYDLNVNTNYNPSAENFARKHYHDVAVPKGLDTLVEFLSGHL